MGHGRQQERARLATALVVGWLLIMAAGGWALATSQSSSRRAVAARVQSKTQYSASFISLYSRDLLARDRAAAQAWLSGPQVGSAALGRTSAALGLQTAAVSRAPGHSGTSASSI
jgi:hypothetical protein